jgi:Tripartite ATP-independent periplasmic transporter, DctM component/Luciferase-like monooxygenase
MSGVRCGLLLLPESLPEFGPLCREAEDAGFQMLGIGDSQSVFREVYVALTVAALYTRRVRLGPQVTNPVSRHLVVTASAWLNMGFITPPVGINLFVIQGVARGSTMREIALGSTPFVLFMLVALLFVFPDLALWLPCQ